VLRPGERFHRSIDVLLASIRPVAQLEEHAARDAAPQIGAIAHSQIAGKRDAAFRGDDRYRTELEQLIAQTAFEAARARREEVLRRVGFVSAVEMAWRLDGGQRSSDRLQRGKKTSSSSLRRWFADSR
jgi:hypothetical protein